MPLKEQNTKERHNGRQTCKSSWPKRKIVSEAKKKENDKQGTGISTQIHFNKYSRSKKIAFSPLLRDKLVWYLRLFFATKAKRKLIIVMETKKTCFS